MIPDPLGSCSDFLAFAIYIFIAFIWAAYFVSFGHSEIPSSIIYPAGGSLIGLCALVAMGRI